MATLIPTRNSAPDKLVTADELLQMPGSERYELVKGVLTAMSPPPGLEHGAITLQLAYWLTQHVRQHDLGRVLAAETGFRLSHAPDTVRAADVAFVAKKRWPAQIPTGYAHLAPDLVAEVVSPSDDPNAVQSKIRDWLEAGVRLVLVVYPGSRQVAVYRSLREVIVLTEQDTLTAPDVLPGFSLPVQEIFS